MTEDTGDTPFHSIAVDILIAITCIRRWFCCCRCRRQVDFSHFERVNVSRFSLSSLLFFQCEFWRMELPTRSNYKKMKKLFSSNVPVAIVVVFTHLIFTPVILSFRITRTFSYGKIFNSDWIWATKKSKDEKHTQAAKRLVFNAITVFDLSDNIILLKSPFYLQLFTLDLVFLPHCGFGRRSCPLFLLRFSICKSIKSNTEYSGNILSENKSVATIGC